MKRVFRKSLLLCLPVLFFSVAAAIAQTCRPESIPATTPASRFADNGDGTVTDKSTGLMWKKCQEGLSGNDCGAGSPAPFTWQGALKRAQEVNASGGFAGYTDWRVPNINELSSIVEEQCYDPSINLGVFPGTQSQSFWSSSPNAYYGFAWDVAFYDGGDYVEYKYGRLYVRLVRSGQ